MSKYKKATSLKEAQQLWPEISVGQSKNLINQQFNQLLVIYRGQSNYKKEASWVCKCNCGNYILVRGSSLRNGKTTSCGCNQIKIIQKIGNNNIKDLTNQQFGRLKVIKRIGTDKYRSPIWECKCQCGNIIQISSHNLLSNHTQSCGCLREENKKKDLTNQQFGYLLALEPEIERKNGCISWKCKCLNCGTITSVRSSHLLERSIKSCGCIKSYGELEIKKYLSKLNISFQTEYSFNDLRDKNPLKFDFAFLNSDNVLLALLEYQGEQHYRKDDNIFGLQQREKTDQMKKDYCKLHNILLYEIKYNEDIQIRLNEILLEVYKNDFKPL